MIKDEIDWKIVLRCIIFWVVNPDLFEKLLMNFAIMSALSSRYCGKPNNRLPTFTLLPLYQPLLQLQPHLKSISELHFDLNINILSNNVLSTTFFDKKLTKNLRKNNTFLVWNEKSLLVQQMYCQSIFYIQNYLFMQLTCKKFKIRNGSFIICLN